MPVDSLRRCAAPRLGSAPRRRGAADRLGRRLMAAATADARRRRTAWPVGTPTTSPGPTAATATRRWHGCSPASRSAVVAGGDRRGRVRPRAPLRDRRRAAPGQGTRRSWPGGIAEPLITRACWRRPRRARDSTARSRPNSRPHADRPGEGVGRPGRIVYSDAPSSSARGSRSAPASSRRSAAGAPRPTRAICRGPRTGPSEFKRLVEVYVGIRGPGGGCSTRTTSAPARSRPAAAANGGCCRPARGGAARPLPDPGAAGLLAGSPAALSPARARGAAAPRDRRLRPRAAPDRRRSARQRRPAPGRRVAVAGGGRQRAPRPRRRREAARAPSPGGGRDPRDDPRAATLLVDIYPATLQRSGLAAALTDLVAPLSAAGMAVTLRVPDAPGCPPTPKRCSTASPRRRCATPVPTGRPPRSRSTSSRSPGRRC